MFGVFAMRMLEGGGGELVDAVERSNELKVMKRNAESFTQR